MKTSRLGFSGLFSLLALTACGGGGGSDSSPPTNPPPPPEPTALEILSNPLDYSESRLNSAATTYADANYSGETKVSTVDISAVQEVYITLFGDNTSGSPYVDQYDIYTFLDENGNVEGTTECYESGSVTYSGKLDEDTGKGTITVDYDQCIQYYDSTRYDGQFSLVITDAGENSSEVTSYFTTLSMLDGGVRTTLKGYLSVDFRYRPQTGTFYEETRQYLTVTHNGETYKVSGTSAEGVTNNTFVSELNGSIYIASKGKLDFAYSSDQGDLPYSSSGSLVVKGDKTAGIDVIDGAVRYGEDNNGDDIYDVGVYFNNLTAFASGNHTGLALSDIDAISVPPVVNQPYYYAYETVYTTDEVTVEPGYYHDSDTPDSELVISFRWYVNGVVLDDVNGTTLPPYSAVFGDEVKVTMVVSDGINVVESQPTFVEIGNSPMTLTASNMPEVVTAGGYVEFTVSMSDPDRVDDDVAGELISAPPGASLNAEGLMTWNVPANQLFNAQTYMFSFASLDGTESQQTLEITSYADKAPAYARTTVMAPIYNHGFAIASTNGVSELITVNARNVGAFSLEGNTLKNTYVYPYKLPTKGEIRSVHTQDVDGDNNDEIYLLTQQGLSVIKDRESNAEAVFIIEDSIISGLFYDINGDGVDEVAYLYGSEYYNATSIAIVDVRTGEQLQQYDIDGVNNLAFGNVDDDASIEMVTNNGYVFDIESGANQWLYGSGFSDAFVVLGDMNNDGVDEIIGADSWNDISIYSAVSKSSLATAEHGDICDIAYSKESPATEGIVVVSECQWGQVRGFALEAGQISEQWALNHNTYSGMSLLIDDLDNDNVDDIIWTGENQILVAQQDANGEYALSDIKGAPRASRYHAAGWAPYGDNDERAVFVSDTSSYESSIQILSVDKEDNFAISAEVGEDVYNYSKPVVTDYNNDGVGELLIGALDYSSSFNVVRLTDNAIQWTLNNNQNSEISFIEAIDVNNDSYADAVIIENNRLKAFDIEHQVLIDSIINDFSINALAASEKDGVHYFAVGGYSSLKLYKMQDGEFVGLNELETNCDQLLTVNFDSDSELEFACLNRNYNTINVYDVASDALELKDAIAPSFYPQYIAAVPTKSSNQSILAIYQPNENDYSYNYYDSIAYRVVEVDNKGNVVWQSPGLGLDNVEGMRTRQNSDGELELQISNPNMALLVK